ncbi:MAG TPA: hypothetical protein VL860_03610, partial [Planctomycetota bacterium]|nr:hypothetical protein [Planctomycetota bacterium]
DLVLSMEDVAAGRAPGGRLMHRWLAAVASYLATGRWTMEQAPLEHWIAHSFDPQTARRMEIWELGLFHALFTELRAGATPALGLLGKLTGRRPDLVTAFSRDYMAAAAKVLEHTLQTGPWAEVIRMATETSARLPEIFHAAEVLAATPEAAAPADRTVQAVQASAEFQAFNRVLDLIAHLEAACDRATTLAQQYQPSATTGTGPAPLRPAAPSHLVGIAPLPPPRSPVDAASPKDRVTDEAILLTPEMVVDSLGVPRERRPAGPAQSSMATAWISPLRALAQDLANLPAFPAFRERLTAWLTAEQPCFHPAWLAPPLTKTERDVLDRHNSGFLARLPALVENQLRTALKDLTVAAQACAINGARELPRFEKAVQAVLICAAVFDRPSGESADAVDPMNELDRAIASVEAAHVIEPTILARMLAGVAAQHTVARHSPRLAALQVLHAALTAGALAMREQRWFDALHALRPALDAWPQYPALQTQWQAALKQGLTAHLNAVERSAASGADLSAVEPAIVAGLVDLLQGPEESNARWLGAWLVQIRGTLERYFAALTAPTVQRLPLEQRRMLATALQSCHRQFDPAGAAAFHEYLALTEQRRRDLTAALENGRAQAALGKLVALWASGEAAQPPGADDLSRAVLHLWLEQTTNAIEQMPAPDDAAALSGLLERMLGPLYKLLELQNSANDRLSAGVVTLAPRDLNEAVLAIETDLYSRMLALAERPADVDLWLAGWREQSFTPVSDGWQAVAQPAPRAALEDFLLARLALREHRLDDAYHALVGAGLGANAAERSGPADLDRFRPVVPQATLLQAIEALLEPWQRLKVTAAKARANVNLDDAAEQLARDLTRAKRLRNHAFPAITAALAELEEQIQLRETARKSVAQRQTVAADLIGRANLAGAVREWQLLKTDWPATACSREQLDQTLALGRTDLRRGLDAQLAHAEQTQRTQPEACLAALKIAAAGLEADSQREFFPRNGGSAATSTAGPDTETALARIFQRWLADQNHRRFGTALLSGLTSGALPPDAPFWAAALQHDRRQDAPPATGRSIGADTQAGLAALPCGAVGPDEWQAWLAATRELYAGHDRATLDELAGRIAAKVAELHRDNEHLAAALAASPGLARRAEALKQFTVQWRNGAIADQRRAELDLLQTNAQAAYDAALEPPAANWLVRPFQHWRNLRAVSEEAQVIGALVEHAAAKKAALNGWLLRSVVIGVALATGITVAVIKLH